jgi:tetratricopeptide (TPR) repeat protein
MSLIRLYCGRPLSAVALFLAAIAGFASLLINSNWDASSDTFDDDVIKGYRELWASPVDIAGGLDAFKSALRQDPASPLRWEDLGGALLKTGRLDQANYCFQQAIQLAPHVPAVQMRLANFEMQTGETLKALATMRGILAETAAYDEIIFSYYQRLAVTTAELLANGIPDTPRAARAFFLYSLSRHDTARTQVIREWSESRGLMHVER